MAISIQHSAKPAPLSWPATLAALTAFATLLATYGTLGGPDSIILFVLMLMLLALRLTGWRLPQASGRTGRCAWLSGR